MILTIRHKLRQNYSQTTYFMHEGPGSHEGIQSEEQHHVSNSESKATQEGSVLQFLVDVVQTRAKGLDIGWRTLYI